MGLNQNKTSGRAPVGGVAGWLLTRFRPGGRPQPKLALLERITLAPRQSLSLVEAEGRRFLIASSPEGAPAFYPLDEQPHSSSSNRVRTTAPASARVSW